MKDKHTSEVSSYINLLNANEEWLMNRILAYAVKHNFSNYTSTLKEAWRLSIKGISDSLIKAAETFNFTIPELDPDDDYLKDPVAAFGITEAIQHRKRGVSLSMFMGLMKYYRQSYMDLFEIECREKPLQRHFKLFTKRCFDRIEIAYTSEWSSNSKDDLLTELKHTNLELTNEKNKYLTIFESYYSPIIFIDEEKNIINLNSSAARLISYKFTPGSYYYNDIKEGKTIHIFDKELTDFIHSSLNELAFESYLETSEGKRFFLVKFKKMLDVSEKFTGIVIILDDLTERKQMETRFEIAKSRAEEADQLKTAFLANMSHEIRTPMNAIIGFSDLLLNDTIKPENRKEYLKLIQKSGNNLLRIIDDIIDIAKIESRQMTIRPVKFKISELLKDLYSIFEEFIKKDDEKDVELILNIDAADNDLVILTDPNRLKQILTNLLSNALKFTFKGSIEFGYNVIDSNNAYFFVKDTGMGIPEDKISLIFERFIQIEGNYTKEFGGTGLGLTITRNIVDLMNGSIWVESVFGEGTTFHFVLPTNYATENMPEKSVFELKDIKTRLSFRNNKILIAEDEEVNYFYLFEILKKTGARIIWAKNGLEAINLVESNPDIDLILMDIKMPEINGLEAIKYIKTIRSGLPIVAQTAFVMDNDKELCMRAGCVDFISKPIKAIHLLDIVNKYLKNNSPVVKKSDIRFPQ